MWPIDPDGFESLTKPPAEFDQARAWYFVCMDGQLASLSERGIPVPIDGDAYRWLDLEIDYEHFLGLYEGRACFAVSAAGPLPEGYAVSGLRAWLGRVEPALFYLAGRALQIIDWHHSHQHCGRCGQPTADHPTDRAKACDQCGLVSYPRLSPSIIVLVRRGNRMLLARNANWPQGMYSTLAGFVEPGESIEQTVHREVYEEVGIEIHNLRYLGSQSWPFPNSLMLGFHADYLRGDLHFKDGEIADAKWFDADALPTIPPATAISRWLIDDFIAELDGS